MPTVTVSDEIYKGLATRAAALRVTVEQLIAPLLDLAAQTHGDGSSTGSPGAVSFDEWKNRLDSWMADVQARASRYPPGFILDDSRESIYEGCGE
jgi:hypothetical protein